MENQLFIKVMGLLVERNMGFVYQNNVVEFDYREQCEVESIHAVDSEVYVFFKDRKSIILQDMEQIRQYAPFKMN